MVQGGILGANGIETIRTIENRREHYGNLTQLLGLRSPSHFLDVLRSVDPSHPTDEDLESRLKETKGRRFDFIGGGITGTTSAYVAAELSRRFGLDWDMHVWDRAEYVGLGSTADSAARTRTSMFGSLEEIRGNLATSLFTENLGKILADGYHELGKTINPDEIFTGLDRCGYLWLFENGNGVRNLEENQRLLASVGLPTFLLDSEEVANIFLPSVNRNAFRIGYFCSTDAHVEPTSITNNLCMYGMNAGVKFHFQHEIDEIRVDSGRNISFRSRYIGNVKTETQEGEHYTYYLAITTGARSKRLGTYFVINGETSPLDVQLTPRLRQLTHVDGFSEDELREYDPFTIFMGKGAYWSRESRNSSQLIFGFARPDDPEVNSDRVHNPGHGSDDYFLERILLEGGLAELCNQFHPETSEMQIINHPGNLYGETADGNYLVGLLRKPNDVRPNGVVGINAGDNGHGIMASLGTGVLLIYRLTGVTARESRLWDPNRNMVSEGGTVRL